MESTQDEDIDLALGSLAEDDVAQLLDMLESLSITPSTLTPSSTTIPTQKRQGVDLDAVRDEHSICTKNHDCTFDITATSNPTSSPTSAAPTLNVDWNTVRDEYEGHVSSYVQKCPFHLFYTYRKRNISRAELKDDICDSIRSWIQLPLTCGEVVDTISHVVHFGMPKPLMWNEDLHPYVFSAMTKNPLIDDEVGSEDRFISALAQELNTYYRLLCKTPSRHHPMPVQFVVPAVRALIERKRTQTVTSIPSRQVHDQIRLFGQYAILSHRWYQDGQELLFADIANFSDPQVQEKKGFKKLEGFSKVVQSHYGCRYLWVDSACIDETDRNESIQHMFGWYRHAYVCVIYLSTAWTGVILDDTWSTRGWTLQEFLAADRVKCFSSDWHPVDSGGKTHTLKFHACRGSTPSFSVYDQLRMATGYVDWKAYKPGADQAIHLFWAMGERRTERPEDMVYSLLSALDVNIPVEYGEGFDMAFYRLQVKLLPQTNDRRLLSWCGHTSSPYNSMLAGGFSWVAGGYWHGPEEIYAHDAALRKHFDPTISFDSNGVMRIMVSIHRLHPSHPYVFALLGETRGQYVGVLLRRLPELETVYRRVGYKECMMNNEISPYKVPEWVYIK